MDNLPLTFIDPFDGDRDRCAGCGAPTPDQCVCPDEYNGYCLDCRCAPDDPAWFDTGDAVSGVSQEYCRCSCHGGASPENGEPW